MTFSVNRIRPLVCVACGHSQRCSIAVEGEVETFPACESCGASEWASWPKIKEPSPGMVEYLNSQASNASLLNVPYGAFRDDDIGSNWACPIHPDGCPPIKDQLSDLFKRYFGSDPGEL